MKQSECCRDSSNRPIRIRIKSTKSPNPSDKFVGRILSPLSNGIDRDVEHENFDAPSEGCKDRPPQASTELVNVEVQGNAKESEAENVQPLKRKHHNSSTPTPSCLGKQKRTKNSPLGLAGTSHGNMSSFIEILRESSTPVSSQVPDHVSQPNLSGVEQEGKSVANEETAGSKEDVSLGPLFERLRALNLIEIGTPPSEPEPIANESDIFTPQWSITRGCSFSSDQECLDFLRHVIPPGTKHGVASENNSVILNSLAHHLIGMMSTSSELTSRISQYEKKVSEACKIVDKVYSEFNKVQKVQAESVENLKAVHAKEVENLEKRLHHFALTDRSKRSEIGSLKQELEKMKDEKRNWKSEEQFFNKTLLAEKERYGKLESDLLLAHREIHTIQHSSQEKQDELIAERAKLSESLSQCKLLLEKNRVLTLDAEKEFSQKKRCITEVVPDVVKKLIQSEEFLAPFRDVMNAERVKLSESLNQCGLLSEKNRILTLNADKIISQKKRCITEVVPDVVKKLIRSEEFLAPFKNVINAGKRRGYQKALIKFHSEGLFGKIPLMEVPGFNPEVDEDYRESLVVLDNITFAFLDKIVASSDLDLEELLALYLKL